MRFYGVNFQYLPKGAARPLDEGQTVDLSDDPVSISALPQVGDFVEIEQSLKGGASFSGRVRSRLFRYIADTAGVNIIVEEITDEEVDWGKLIKE